MGLRQDLVRAAELAAASAIKDGTDWKAREGELANAKTALEAVALAPAAAEDDQLVGLLRRRVGHLEAAVGALLTNSQRMEQDFLAAESHQGRRQAARLRMAIDEAAQLIGQAPVDPAQANGAEASAL